MRQMHGSLVSTWVCGAYLRCLCSSGTLKGARVLQFVFFSLTVLFALLVIGNIAGNAAIIHFAGWIGLICGASAIYLAMGEVLNEQFGRRSCRLVNPTNCLRSPARGGFFLFANFASCTLRFECCNHFRCRFRRMALPATEYGTVRWQNTVHHNVTLSVPSPSSVSLIRLPVDRVS